MKYLLGIDNGLTAIKAALFDTEGKRIRTACRYTPISGDEIDMEQLWQRTAECIREAAGSDGENIIAVANSGHGNGLYAVDKDLNPVYSAITSMTKRPKNIDDVSEDLFAKTMQKVWEGQPAFILRWIKENDPEVYKKIYKFMLCKDYIRLRLTGKITSDYTDMSAAGLINNITKEYDREIFRLIRIDEMYDALPELRKSTEIAGRVTHAAAQITGIAEGAPVAGGMFDVNACVLGSGALNCYGIIAGTWGVNAAVSDMPRSSREILQCCIFADNKKYICIESAPNSAGNLEWFMKKILNESDFAEADRIVESTPGNEVFYFPYIYGTLMSGSFLGLKASHGKGDMLRAVFEGICFEHRLQIGRIKKAGIKLKSAVLSGGAASSEVWSQMFADVLEIPVCVMQEKQAGTLGAAAAAAVCGGVYKDIYEAAEHMVKTEKKYLPQKDYSEKYAKYKKYVRRLKGI